MHNLDGVSMLNCKISHPHLQVHKYFWSENRDHKNCTMHSFLILELTMASKLESDMAEYNTLRICHLEQTLFEASHHEAEMIPSSCQLQHDHLSWTCMYIYPARGRRPARR